MHADFGVAMIGPLALRVGADDEEIGARALAPVRDPSRDDDNIAGPQFDGLSAVAAEPRTRAFPAAIPSTSCAVL